MQKAPVVQLTAVSPWELTRVTLQVEVLEAGALATAKPEESTATQVALAEQETPVRLTPSVYATDQAPPLDGVVLTRMFPLVSTATQRALLAQETPTRSLPGPAPR